MKKYITCLFLFSLSGVAESAITFYRSETTWATTYASMPPVYIQTPVFNFAFENFTLVRPVDWVGVISGGQDAYAANLLAVAHNDQPNGLTTIDSNGISIGTNARNGIKFAPVGRSYFIGNMYGVSSFGILLETDSVDWVVQIGGVEYPVESGFMGWISLTGQIGSVYNTQNSIGNIVDFSIYNNSFIETSDSLSITQIQYGLVPEPSITVLSAGGLLFFRRKRVR